MNSSILAAAIAVSVQVAPALPTDADEVRPADTVRTVPPAMTTEEARLTACISTLGTDAPSAIAEASQWASQERGAGRTYPLHCLGMAYMWMNRHAAAAEAFIEARDLTLPSSTAERARFGAMAAIALEAGGDMEAAVAAATAAEADALAGGDAILAAAIARDVASPLVRLERFAEADAALARARGYNAQDPLTWLISARFARSQERLTDAQAYIQTAAALSPRDPHVGLEAGIIAALAGRDGAARLSFQSVIALAPNTLLAERAQAYIDQLPPPLGR